MKFFIFFCIFLTGNLFAKVDEIKLKESVKGAAQKIITEKGFKLIDENELNKSTDSIEDDCIDDTCLVDIGKGVQAKRLFKIEIKSMSKNEQLIEFKNINIETNTVIKTESFMFKDSLDKYQDIYNIIDGIVFGNVKKSKNKEVAILKIILPKINLSEKDKVDSFMSYGKKKKWEKTLKKVNKTLRSAAEQIITRKNFTILDLSIQSEALAEQAKANEDECIDDTCLMDTGKMLAASRIFIVKISMLGKNQYLFKITHMNLETNEMLKSQSEIYQGDLNDFSKLFAFGRKFFQTIFQDEEVQKGEKIPVMLQIMVDKEKQEDDGIETVLLTIKTPYDPVNVYHGGENFGITPLTVKVPKGTYLLKFKKEGYDDAETKYELKKDSKLFFKKIYTKGGPYPVTITTKLPSTFKYKKEIGNTPKTIYLKKGTHKVQLENDIAGLKEFNIDITTEEEFNFKMNRGFSYVTLSPNFEFWYQNFPWQQKSTYLMLGIKARFFVWNWKYFDLDIIGGGFSMNMQFDKIYSWQFHILEFNIKPTSYLTLRLNLGPIGGDVTRFYYSGNKATKEVTKDGNKTLELVDRVEYAMALAGAKINYKYTIFNMLSINAYLGFYWGNHSNEDSLYTEKDSYEVPDPTPTNPDNTKSVMIEEDYGWLFNAGISVDVKF